MRTKFRISENNTIKASLRCTEHGKLLSTVYDSGFTTIKQVQSTLLRKVPHYTGKSATVSITNLDKEENKTYQIKLN